MGNKNQTQKRAANMFEKMFENALKENKVDNGLLFDRDATFYARKM